MNKSIVSTVFKIAIGMFIMLSMSITAGAYTRGDVNGDSVVDAEDALIALRYSVKLQSLTKEQQEYCDMNGDGKVDSLDTLMILRSSVALSDKLSVNDPCFWLNEPVNGIDVSLWQGDIDFQAVKQSGIDFVIIRAGGATDNPAENHPGIAGVRQGVDPRFEMNYAAAKAAGLNVGVYWYSFAVNEEQAAKEAESCLRAIKGKEFEYPVFYDIENPYQFEKGRDFCSNILDIFCSKIKENGYYTAFYMSTYFAQNYLTDEVKRKYDCWLAEWKDSPTYQGEYVMWQKGIGRVNGVYTDVDIDFSYVDYPAYIKKHYWE